MSHIARAPRSDCDFFWSSPILAGRCYKNPQSARGPLQCKSGPKITWLVNVTIYCIFFNSNTSSPCQFLRTKYFKKISSGKLLIEQIIEFELKGPGPPGRTCNSITG